MKIIFDFIGIYSINDFVNFISGLTVFVALFVWLRESFKTIIKRKKYLKSFSESTNCIALAIAIPMNNDEEIDSMQDAADSLGVSPKKSIDKKYGIGEDVSKFILSKTEMKSKFGVKKKSELKKLIYPITTKAMPFSESCKKDSVYSVKAQDSIKNLLKEIAVFEETINGTKPTICLFYRGPYAPIAAVAARLSNRYNVELYQFDIKCNSYYCVGSLEPRE